MGRIERFTDVDDEGLISPAFVERFILDIGAKFPSSRIKLSADKSRKIRSLNQNNYYFGVIVQACREGVQSEWGEEYSTEESHDLLKKECNYKEVASEETGEILRLPKSTKRLDTLQGEEYYERCRKWIFLWFGITVPLPNEQTALEYYERAKARSGS